VGVESDGSAQFKFVMSSGEKNDLSWNGQAGAMIKVQPEGSAIAKILVNYHTTCISRGIKLFTKDGTCVLQAGDFSGN